MTRRSFLSAIRNAVVTAGLSPLVGPVFSLKPDHLFKSLTETSAWVITEIKGGEIVFCRADEQQQQMFESTWGINNWITEPIP